MQFGLWFQLPPDRRPQEVKNYEGGLIIAIGLAFGVAVGMFLFDCQLKTIFYTVLAYVVIVFFGAHLSNKEVLEVARKVALEHKDTLRMKRERASYADAYGMKDEAKWSDEKYYFVSNVIKAALTEKKYNTSFSQRTLYRIYDILDEVAPATPVYQRPTYEH